MQSRQDDSAAGHATLAGLLSGLPAKAPVVLFVVDPAGVDRDRGRSVFEELRDDPPALAAVRRALAGEPGAAPVNAVGRSWTVSFLPTRDLSGAGTGAVVVAESRAERNLWFLDSIVENIPDMIFVKDAEDLRFVRFNRAGEELLGHPRAELIGRNDYDFFPAEQADFFTGKDRAVLAGGEVLDIPEEPIQTPRGLRILHTKKIPVVDEIGRPRYLLGISEDITERKRVDRDRERLVAELRELDRMKAQLTANVSHELRTPLTLILALTARLARRGDRPEEELRDLGSVERNARILLKLVEDLLDISRLEAGRLAPAYADVDLARLVRLTASAFEGAARERGLELVVDASASLPAQVDPDQVQRILGNLLGNALKFTPAGGRVRCAVAARGGRAALTVADTGPGVPAELRERIFERFYQVTGGGAALGGAGLGLAIVRELTALHGGRVAVDDAPGGGARFTVELPLVAPHDAEVRRAALVGAPPPPALAAPPRPAPAAPAAAPAPDGRPLLLVVEDNPEMNRFLAETFADDYRVVSASDGEEGLRIALATHPDLVLTDVMMPRLRGDELLRALRERPELDDVAVVVVTAHAEEEARVELLRRGAQDYVLKPFSVEELRARVGNLVTLGRARELLRSELATRRADVHGLLVELTRRKRELESAWQSAEVAREQAERASAFRDDLMTMLAHELRTPVAALRLRLDLLEHARQVAPADVVVEHARRLGASAERLYRLVDSLIEFCRVERGRVRIHAEPIDLRTMAEDVLDELRPVAARKSLVLRLAAPSDLPPIESDPRLVRLILRNLVGNAAKFTERGSVVLELHAGERFLIAVRDTGPGIPLALRRRIFEPFVQGAEITAKHHEGIGLGLALVREVVRALGGTIDLESREGAGSTFTVSLPPRLAEATPLERMWGP